MTDITRDSSSQQLRQLANHLSELDWHNSAAELRDLADRVATLEGNLIYFGSILCADADDATAPKNASQTKLRRFDTILGAVQDAMRGSPVWKYGSDASNTFNRAGRLRAEITKRLKVKT